MVEMIRKEDRRKWHVNDVIVGGLGRCDVTMGGRGTQVGSPGGDRNASGSTSVQNEIET